MYVIIELGLVVSLAFVSMLVNRCLYIRESESFEWCASPSSFDVAGSLKLEWRRPPSEVGSQATEVRVYG